MPKLHPESDLDFGPIPNLIDSNVRLTVRLAQVEAQRLGWRFIATEHILMSMLRSQLGLGARLLLSLNVNVTKVEIAFDVCGIGFGTEEAKVRRALQLAGGTPQLQCVELEKEMPLTFSSGHSLRLADSICKNYRHESLGTEHLLLGLAWEQDGVAGRLLENLGIRAQVLTSEFEKFERR